MSAKVTTHAPHARPFDVTLFVPAGRAVQRVRAGETQDFHIFDARDLHIHKVQPHEIEADSPRD